MKIIKALFVCLAVTTALSSCGLFRKTDRKTDKVKFDSTYNRSVKELTIDTGTTTIKERVDTQLHVKGYELNAELKVKPNADGTYPKFEAPGISVDTAISTLKVYYDSLTHSVKVLSRVKDQVIPFQINKTTTIKAGLTKMSEQHDKGQTKKSETHETKATRPDYSWIWWLLGLSGVILLILYLYSRFKR